MFFSSSLRRVRVGLKIRTPLSSTGKKLIKSYSAKALHLNLNTHLDPQQASYIQAANPIIAKVAREKIFSLAKNKSGANF